MAVYAPEKDRYVWNTCLSKKGLCLFVGSNAREKIGTPCCFWASEKSPLVRELNRGKVDTQMAGEIIGGEAEILSLCQFFTLNDLL